MPICDIPRQQIIGAFPCTGILAEADRLRAVDAADGNANAPNIRTRRTKASENLRRVENDRWHSTWDGTDAYVLAPKGSLLEYIFRSGDAAIRRDHNVNDVNVRFTLHPVPGATGK